MVAAVVGRKQVTGLIYPKAIILYCKPPGDNLPGVGPGGHLNLGPVYLDACTWKE
jgi:hypothetical protein